MEAPQKKGKQKLISEENDEKRLKDKPVLNVPDDQGCIAKALPVELHFEKQSSEARREVYSQIIEVMRSELFYWDTFPITLPPSSTDVFARHNEERDAFEANPALFQPAPSFDELEELAFDPNTNKLKKLSKEQLKEIWKTGKFTIPSVRFPGKDHVWELTPFLSVGTNYIYETFNSTLGVAIGQFLQIPKRIISPNCSVSEGIKHIGLSFVELISLFVGLRETERQYSDYQIETYISTLKKVILLKGFSESAQSLRTAIENRYLDRINTRDSNGSPKFPKFLWGEKLPFDVAHSKEDVSIDLRLWSISGFNENNYYYDNRTAVYQEIEKIWNLCESRWAIKKHSVTKKIQEAILKSTMSENDEEESEEEEEKRIKELAQLVANKVEKTRQKKIFKAFSTSATLDKLSPGIAKLLLTEWKITQLFIDLTRTFSAERDLQVEAFTEKLKSQHPTLFTIERWRNEHVTAFTVSYNSARRMEIFKRSLALLENYAKKKKDHPYYDFSTAIFLLNRYIQLESKFETSKYANNFSEVTKDLKSKKVPSRIYTWSRHIWSPNNWPISFDPVNQTYYAQTFKQVSVESSTPGFRILNIITKSITWLNNHAYRLWLLNILNGPLGIKALFKLSSFRPFKMVDSATGLLIPNPHRNVATYFARLCEIVKSARDGVNRFEALPDTGFLGKSVTRIFNRIWNYGCKLIIGGSLVALGFPILVVLNIAVSLFLILTEILWVPISAILKYLFNVLVYDTESARFPLFRPALFPIFSIVLGRAGLFGAVQIIFALLSSTVIHPGLGIGIGVFAGLHACLRAMYDAFCFYLIVKRAGRMPKTNSFVAKRVQGPGLSSQYYYQIAPDAAISALQIELETEHLNFFSDTMYAKIRKPLVEYGNFCCEVLRPFLGSAGQSGYSRGNSEFLDNKTENLSTRLNNLVTTRRNLFPQRFHSGYLIRQSPVALAATIWQGSEIVERHVTNEIFDKLYKGDESKITQYWVTKNLAEGDWLGLTRKFLENAFSKSFLIPLRMSDTSVKLEVNKTEQWHEFVKLVKEGKGKTSEEDMKVKIATITSVGELAPTIYQISLTDLPGFGGEYHNNFLDTYEVLERTRIGVGGAEILLKGKETEW